MGRPGRCSVLGLGVLLGLGVSCSEAAPDSRGAEGAACRTDGSCNAGLVCVLELCVRARELGGPAPDGWHPPDGPRLEARLEGPAPPPADLRRDGPVPPKPDLKPPPAPDLPSPAACTSWSGWSCIAWPKPGVACWSTCPGTSGALWCSSPMGDCFCTSGGGAACAKVPLPSSKPCDACKAALETHGCCKPGK